MKRISLKVVFLALILILSLGCVFLLLLFPKALPITTSRKDATLIAFQLRQQYLSPSSDLETPKEYRKLHFLFTTEVKEVKFSEFVSYFELEPGVFLVFSSTPESETWGYSELLSSQKVVDRVYRKISVPYIYYGIEDVALVYEYGMFERPEVCVPAGGACGNKGLFLKNLQDVGTPTYVFVYCFISNTASEGGILACDTAVKSMDLHRWTQE